MIVKLKYILSSLGVFFILDLIRRIPDTLGWLQAGCCGIAPSPIKRMVLSAYCGRYGLTKFIETGTHLGDTLAFMARKKNMDATSIELDEAYYLSAKKRFANYRNITLIQGDSGKCLPELVRQLKVPALFWLDGHYSGDDTAKGVLDTPISAELESILNSPIKGHVILIDDARCFDATHDYPHLDILLEKVRRLNTYHIEVSADIIRLTPKN